MASLRKELSLAADSDRVWSALREFAAVMAATLGQAPSAAP